MPETSVIKLPRLFVADDLRTGQPIRLADAQGHYLRNVMRREPGDALRLFNGRDGEFLASLDCPDRKSAFAMPGTQSRPQPPNTYETHLIFAPLKKDALDFLIQKAVELGVTHLHPVFTRHTEAKRLNEDRARAHIIEAAEQCERLTLPALHPPRELASFLETWDADISLFAAVERADAPLLPAACGTRVAYLIGPEGGFSTEEKNLLAARPGLQAVSLGASILRAETAALFCLAARRLGLGGV